MDTNVKFTDPFYNSDEFSIDGQYKEFDSQGKEKKESSYALRTAEESGDYNFPAMPGGAPPPYSLATAGTTPTTSTSTSSSNVNWNNITNNAPQILGAIGNIIGAVQGGGGTGSGTGVESVCGKPPLIVITGAKKRAYEQCAADYAQQQAAIAAAQANAGRGQDGGGMSTTTKILIGVGIFIFLIIIVVLIIVLSRKKQESK